MSRIIDINKQKPSVGSKLSQLEQAVVTLIQSAQIRNNQMAVYAKLLRENMGLSEAEFVTRYEEAEKVLIEQAKAKNEADAKS